MNRRKSPTNLRFFVAFNRELLVIFIAKPQYFLSLNLIDNIRKNDYAFNIVKKGIKTRIL